MQAPSRNKHKGLIVAGMHSSGGKTAVTSLLLAALRKRNLALQPFKVGPDYIDPGYHFHFSAKHSVNLDPWIMGREHVIQAAQQFTGNAIGLAEGVMGLFDGSDPTNDSGSTMEVARWLQWPILLVVPCRNAGRSINAAIHSVGRCLSGQPISRNTRSTPFSAPHGSSIPSSSKLCSRTVISFVF